MVVRDMVARHSNYSETRDFVPTPPYATRALFEYVMPEWKLAPPYSLAWDPAAGHGHMTRVFKEYGFNGFGTDIEPCPEEGITGEDFISSTDRAFFIITNPPYNLLNEFIETGLSQCDRGLALLVRVQALESQTRYAKVWKKTPPTQIAFFSDRIPFKLGRVTRKAPKMFFHMWVCWDKFNTEPRPPMWIPPDAQQKLEKDSDYA